MDPTDPQKLTPSDREEISYLLQAEEVEFRKAVNEYVAQQVGTGSGARVFRSADLVGRTWSALNALIAETTRTLDGRTKGGTSRTDLRAHKSKLAAERKVTAQIRETVRQQQAAETSPRKRALEALVALHPADFTALRRAIEGGADPAAAVERIRADRARKCESHP